MPFDGLKEDIAFADIDLLAVTPHVFGDGGESTPRVLVSAAGGRESLLPLGVP